MSDEPLFTGALDCNGKFLQSGDYVKYSHPFACGDTIGRITNVYCTATIWSTYWFVSVAHFTRYVIPPSGNPPWEQTVQQEFISHSVKKVTVQEYDEFKIIRKLTT